MQVVITFPAYSRVQGTISANGVTEKFTRSYSVGYNVKVRSLGLSKKQVVELIGKAQGIASKPVSDAIAQYGYDSKGHIDAVNANKNEPIVLDV